LSRSPSVTQDALFEGRVHLVQPARGAGYRANVDAILLAAFAGDGRRPARLAADLGAGVGAVALSLAHLGYARRVALVERDAALVRLAVRNFSLNGWTERVEIHEGDLDRPLAAIAPGLVHAVDLVVCNPPYTSTARDGRPPKDPEERVRAASRRGDLQPFLRAAAEALGRRSRACFVYPAGDLADFFALARAVKLEPKRLRFVHGRGERPARVALVELCFGRTGGLSVLPPLIETDGVGRRSPELDRLLGASRAE
jgi:tRNA1Val (adenine37-N6)-methyltransferase